jgi:hypothetical protein
MLGIHVKYIQHVWTYAWHPREIHTARADTEEHHETSVIGTSMHHETSYIEHHETSDIE